MPSDKIVPESVTAYAIIRDGYFQGSGFLPAYRVVTVVAEKNGESVIEVSDQKYVVAEAQSIVEDKIREGLGL